MKLAEALSIVRKGPTDGTAFNVVLACGFTPLHLQNYLAAYLQQSMPQRKVNVTAGLFEDVSGTVKGLNEVDNQAAAVVLEWSDLDSRLGYRHVGGWGHRVVPSILENVQARLNHLEFLIGEVRPATKLVVALSTLPLPPGFHTSSGQASEAELALRAAVIGFACRLAAHPSVAIVNASKLDSLSPVDARYDFRGDLHTGFPYTLGHADKLGSLLAELINSPKPKKGLITDLDDTLWSGLVGEIGHDQVSWDLSSNTQIHGLYQQMLGALADQGVLIAVASKNSPELAREALARTDLVISGDKIFPVEIHWEPKSGSVSRILKTWNISADSVVFIDDSPMELAEVKAAHPDIECLLFPKSDYPAAFAFLQQLRDLFGKPKLSEEDSYRLQSIRQGQQFMESESSGASTEALLAGAEAVITFEYNPPASDKRVVELVNKTNQFNLNGRRYTDSEWHEALQDPDAFALAISYQDKFGPLGKIAVVRGRRDVDSLHIDTWVLSCRAFSRRIEFQTLANLFKRFPVHSVTFDFASTPKNKPTESFLNAMGLENLSAGTQLSREHFFANCPKLHHQVLEKNG